MDKALRNLFPFGRCIQTCDISVLNIRHHDQRRVASDRFPNAVPQLIAAAREVMNRFSRAERKSREVISCEKAARALPKQLLTVVLPRRSRRALPDKTTSVPRARPRNVGEHKFLVANNGLHDSLLAANATCSQPSDLSDLSCLLQKVLPPYLKPVREERALGTVDQRGKEWSSEIASRASPSLPSGVWLAVEASSVSQALSTRRLAV